MSTPNKYYLLPAKLCCCSEHRDSCFNVDESTLPDGADKNVTITDIEMCFCSTDRCRHSITSTSPFRLQICLLLANIHAIRHDVTVSNWANLPRSLSHI